MATRVGSAVTGTADAAAGSIAASAKNTTSTNALIAYIKWEEGATLSSVTDTAGNTWTIQTQVAFTAGVSPAGAIAYCLNITGNASNVVTANFSAGTAQFRRIAVVEVAGLGTAGIDGTPTNSSGTGTTYTTGSITTTTTGYSFYGVSGFTALTSITDGSTPTHTIDTNVSDTFIGSLLSGSAQTITYSASATGSGTWKMLAVAFKDAPPTAPTINQQPTSLKIVSNNYAPLQVVATTSGGALSYQWKDNRSGSFANVIDGTGGTSAAYNTAVLTSSASGRQYQCVVTDSNGSVTTNNVTITVVDSSTGILGLFDPQLRIQSWF